MREMVLRAGASASTVGSSSEAAAANTESRGPMSGMGSSGGGPQRSGLLSLGAAAAAARGRGSADSSSATPRPRFAAHATPAPEDEGTIQALCACVRAAAGDERGSEADLFGGGNKRPQRSWPPRGPQRHPSTAPRRPRRRPLRWAALASVESNESIWPPAGALAGALANRLAAILAFAGTPAVRTHLKHAKLRASCKLRTGSGGPRRP